MYIPENLIQEKNSKLYKYVRFTLNVSPPQAPNINNALASKYVRYKIQGRLNYFFDEFYSPLILYIQKQFFMFFEIL